MPPPGTLPAMKFRMWMMDVAREQSPSYESLQAWCRLSLDAGYNAMGLYLEHRFAYPSLPWVHGRGALEPAVVQKLQGEFPDLQLIPFINLLGHFEGFLYTEEGAKFAEETFRGMQANPLHPEFGALCRTILDDTIAAFSSEIVHIGGDETWQLGVGEASAARVREAELSGAPDGKAVLYGEHFGPLAQYVLDQGRRPAVWGDMFAQHPDALALIPPETLIFDWQYFSGPRPPASAHEKVYCPAIHTYNALWCHLPQSERNVVEHAAAAEADGAYGVCVTTWECGLFGNYNTLKPAIRASGAILNSPSGDSPEPLAALAENVARYAESKDAPRFLKAYLQESETSEEWARLLGCELQEAGGLFAFGNIRSSIKARLLLFSNPFLLDLRDGDDLFSPSGEKALEILDRAAHFATGPDERGPVQLGIKALEFIRQCRRARIAYADHKPGEAMNHLAPCRQIFEDLEKIAVATSINADGSLADVERCRIARRHVETVIGRIKQYGDGSLGYLPSWATITHPKFVPHDQANWWLINRWANV